MHVMHLRSRLGSLSAVLLVAAGLAGCSGDDGAAETGTGTGTATMTATSTTSAGTAGTAGTSDGTAGETRTTGASTTGSSTTGGLDGGFCAHQCEVDADCWVSGMDLDFTCKGGFCSGEASEGCVSDEACVALFSGWTTSCTAGGGECEPLAQVCVKAGAEGLCALPPGDFFTCADFGMDEVMVDKIDGGSVMVCAQTRAECDGGACTVKCASNEHCMSAAYPVCEVGTGACACGSDADCATIGTPHTSRCLDGICGCPNDQACVDGGAGDVCRDGVCGCSGDAACAGVTNPFDGGAIACVEF